MAYIISYISAIRSQLIVNLLDSNLMCSVLFPVSCFRYFSGEKTDWHVWSRGKLCWRLRYNSGAVVEALQVGAAKATPYPRARPGRQAARSPRAGPFKPRAAKSEAREKVVLALSGGSEFFQHCMYVVYCTTYKYITYYNYVVRICGRLFGRFSSRPCCPLSPLAGCVRPVGRHEASSCGCAGALARVPDIKQIKLN